MSPVAVLGWAAFAYVLLRSLRYLLAARLYLICALREVEAHPLDRQQLDPGELRLLSLLDEELIAAGFRSLGFGSVGASVTYYGGPLMTAVFVNERIPAYAFVHRHLAPEYGRLVELDVRTALASGEEIVTGNTPSSGAFVPPGMHIETHPGVSVRDLVERHGARVDVARAGGKIPDHSSLQDALGLITGQMAKSRSVFRQRKWALPTTDPRLDRFTLRGVVPLILDANRTVAARRAALARQARAPTIAPPTQPTSDTERALRVEADLLATLQVAEHPESAPGTPWPMLTVIAITAVLSFVAMAVLWDPYFAALILAVITFHEGGHATAMRMFGYRDVHVFFVPLLGAMTVGRAAVTSVRDRLIVVLAGPVPGLWLAVVLFGLGELYGSSAMAHKAALALLILNGLNLLPFTPLDGGRVVEALSKPESVLRLVVHGLSSVGLLVVAAYVRDPVVAVLGVIWVAMFPRYLASYRLRNAVAAVVADRNDFRAVARAALEVMLTPAYSKFRAVTRQATARALARLFAESLATPADRRWGVIAYAAAWIPVVAALLLWKK